MGVAGAAVGEILAALAVAILQWWASRKDIRETERGRIALEAAQLGRKALEWKAGAAMADDGGAQLRVRDGAGQLSGFDADPQRGPDHGEVPPRG